MENTQLKIIIKTLEKIVTKVDRLEDGQGRLATKVDRLEPLVKKVDRLEQLVIKFDRLATKVDLLESGQDKILEQMDIKTTEIMQAVNSDKQYSHQAFQWIGKLQAEMDQLKKQVASLVR